MRRENGRRLPKVTRKSFRRPHVNKSKYIVLIQKNDYNKKSTMWISQSYCTLLIFRVVWTICLLRLEPFTIITGMKCHSLWLSCHNSRFSWWRLLLNSVHICSVIFKTGFFRWTDSRISRTSSGEGLIQSTWKVRIKTGKIVLIIIKKCRDQTGNDSHSH